MQCCADFAPLVCIHPVFDDPLIGTRGRDDPSILEHRLRVAAISALANSSGMWKTLSGGFVVS